MSVSSIVMRPLASGTRKPQNARMYGFSNTSAATPVAELRHMLEKQKTEHPPRVLRRTVLVRIIPDVLGLQVLPREPRCAASGFVRPESRRREKAREKGLCSCGLWGDTCRQAPWRSTRFLRG